MMTKLRFSLLAAAAMTMCASAADVRPTQGSPAGAGVVDPSMAPGHTQVIDGLTLTTDWDKVFAPSDAVEHTKVVFHNRFGIKLAADLYLPKNRSGKLPAIAVSGPFGAVKEQVSGQYAQKLAEQGFIALAFDPSFTGESGGEGRFMASPDFGTEDFSAAVDYLSNHDDVDANAIGILGICGWGGFAVNTAAIDTRIKATVASTMYDMTRVTAKGYDDAADTKEARAAMRKAFSEQRTLDYNAPLAKRAGGVPAELPDDAPQFMKDYHAFYKTERGYHPRSLGSNDGWLFTSASTLLNAPILHYANEIDSAVLIVHGADAHSRYMGEGAYQQLVGDNKKLIIVPNARHTDLYDDFTKIPMDEIVSFYNSSLK